MHGASGGRKLGTFALVWIGIVVSGLLAFLFLRSRLILTWPTRYANVQGLLFALLFMVLILVVSMSKRIDDSLAVRYPTKWLRWFVMKPLVAAVMAGSVLAAPAGWIGLGTWAWGTDTRVPGRVVTVEALRSAKGCDQHATLAIQRVEKKVCLADHYVGVELAAGQVLDVQLRSTSLGIIIGDIAPQ